MHYLIVLLALAVSGTMTSALECDCPKTKPICANDGNTYSSKCIVDCIIDIMKNKYKVVNPEKSFYIVDNKACPLKEDDARNICLCPKIVDPVCGSDNKTYDNDCSLNCEARKAIGIRKAHHGSCPESLFIRKHKG